MISLGAWVFLQVILKLITKLGGTNPYMAIRFFELGILAVIGIGIETYNNFRSFSQLKMDYLNRKLEFLK